jgi:hypothetical protein
VSVALQMVLSMEGVECRSRNGSATLAQRFPRG